MLSELIALSAENTYAYIFIGQLPNSIQLGKDSPIQYIHKAPAGGQKTWL